MNHTKQSSAKKPPADFPGPVTVCTVGWPIRGPKGREEIHLGTKARTPKAIKRGIAGKLLPFGGDIEPEDRSVIEAYAREFNAESRGMTVEPRDVEVVARIVIKNTAKPTIILYILFARNCKGIARPTREFEDNGWYPARPVPENVLEGDKVILPRLLDGEKLEGWILYDGRVEGCMPLIDHDLRPVDSVSVDIKRDI